MRALLDFAGTLIFSRTFSPSADSMAIGSTNLTDVDFANFFLRCARSFSLLAAILEKWNYMRTWDKREWSHIPVFPERMFPALLDFGNPLHGLYRCLYQLAIVAYRNISAFLEVDCWILWHFSAKPWYGRMRQHTIVISFPAAFLNAFVHLTLRGLRFILQLVSTIIKYRKCYSSLKVLMTSKKHDE